MPESRGRWEGTSAVGTRGFYSGGGEGEEGILKEDLPGV